MLRQIAKVFCGEAVKAAVAMNRFQGMLVCDFDPSDAHRIKV